VELDVGGCAVGHDAIDRDRGVRLAGGRGPHEAASEQHLSVRDARVERDAGRCGTRRQGSPGRRGDEEQEEAHDEER